MGTSPTTERQQSVQHAWVLDDRDDGQEAHGWRGVEARRESEPRRYVVGSPVVQSASATGEARAADADREGVVGPRPRRGELPTEVLDELAGAVGRERGERFADQLAVAVRAYERDRYEETFRITRDLLAKVPESLAAVELHGLACYRLGRWQLAIRHLSTVVERDTADGAQLPVLMDCHRALGHHHRVGELWEELRSLSPDADVLVEGRLVLAADLADRGQLTDAIAVLVDAGAARSLRRPADRHLRQWYVLADLYERAGELPRARDLFELVVTHDPGLADAEARSSALGALERGTPLEGARRATATLGELAGSPARRSRGR